VPRLTAPTVTSATAPEASRPVVAPRTDIVETAEAIILIIDMPGVSPESVDVTTQRELLTVRGTAQLAVPPGYIQHEREFLIADYERTFGLGAHLERDAVRASMSNGVLRLEIPKSPASRKRHVNVTGG
jgi:HSP20 family protein